MKHDLRDNKVLHKHRCVAQLGRRCVRDAEVTAGSIYYRIIDW